MNSKGQTDQWPIALALVATAALGFLAGRFIGPTAEAPGPTSIEAQIPVVQEVIESPPDAAPQGDPDPPNIESEDTQPLDLEQFQPERETVVSLLRLPTEFQQTAALYALVNRSDVSAIQRHLEDVRKIPETSDQRAARSILYLRYSELDPDGALRHVYASGVPEIPQLVHALFHAWSKFDLQGAISRLSLVRGERHYQIASNAILQANADSDPETLETIARQMGGSASVDSVRARSLIQRSDTDPAVALREIQALENHNVRVQAMYQFAQAAYQRNALAALDYSGQIERPEDRRNFRIAVLSQYASDDPEGALRMVDDNMGLQERQILTHSALSNLAQSDPVHALDLARNLDHVPDRPQVISNVMSNWAQKDPAAAAQALMELEEHGLAERIGYSVIFPYIQQDRDGALAWAKTVDDGHGQMWRMAVGQIARSDPEYAMALVDEMPASPRKAETLADVVGSISSHSPWQAVELLEHIPEGPMRDQARTQIAFQWVNNEPAAAMEWLLTQPTAVQASTVPSMAYRVAELDMALALSFTDDLQGEARQQWIASLVDQYARRDARNASQWIREYADMDQYGYWAGTIAGQLLSGGEEREARLLIDEISTPEQRTVARQHLLSNWSARDPEAAARWLMKLDEADREHGMVTSVVRSWFHYDPEAATRFATKIREPEQRDWAIATVLESGHVDAREARRLIDRTGTEAGRAQAIDTYVTQLAQRDVEAARRFIAKINLSDDRRAMLEQSIQRIQGIRNPVVN